MKSECIASPGRAAGDAEGVDAVRPSTVHLHEAPQHNHSHYGGVHNRNGSGNDNHAKRKQQQTSMNPSQHLPAISHGASAGSKAAAWTRHLASRTTHAAAPRAASGGADDRFPPRNNYFSSSTPPLRSDRQRSSTNEAPSPFRASAAPSVYVDADRDARTCTEAESCSSTARKPAVNTAMTNGSDSKPMQGASYVLMTPIQMRRMMASRMGAMSPGRAAATATNTTIAPPYALINSSVKGSAVANAREDLPQAIKNLQDCLKELETAEQKRKVADATSANPPEAAAMNDVKSVVSESDLTALRGLHAHLGGFLLSVGALPEMAAEVKALTGVDPSPLDRARTSGGGGGGGGGDSDSSSNRRTPFFLEPGSDDNAAVRRSSDNSAVRGEAVGGVNGDSRSISKHDDGTDKTDTGRGANFSEPATGTTGSEGLPDAPAATTRCNPHPRRTPVLMRSDGKSEDNNNSDSSSKGSGEEEGNIDDDIAGLHFKRALGKVDNIMADADLAFQRVQKFASDMSMLIQSWAAVASEHFEELSVDLLTLILREHPTYDALFLTKDFHEQARTIVGMLGKAVVAFARPDDIMGLMSEIGARHCLYGVGEEHFKATRDAFFRVYPKYVTKDMYDNSIEVWHMFWTTVIGLMTNGNHSDRASHYRKMRREQWVRRLQQGLSVLVPLQQAEPDDERKHLFIPVMYDIAVKAVPSIAVFHRLRDIRPSDRSFESIGRIIEHLHDDEKVRRYCTDLANRHIGYGITVEVFSIVKGPFLEALDYFMKDQPIYSPALTRAFADFWDYMVELWTPELRVNDTAGLETGSAPDGTKPFAILFTDIEASTSLWETNPDAMRHAVHTHHAIIRGLIADYGGYEVKTVGDSFMVVAKDPHIALKIALGIQIEMMRKRISSGFSMSAAVPEPQGSGDASCWRDDSLRVRVGIHYSTDASAVYDGVHRRLDYYGPAVNCAARIQAAACGGEILISKEVVEALGDTGFYTEPHPRFLAGHGLGMGVESPLTASAADDDAALPCSESNASGMRSHSANDPSHTSRAFSARPLSDLVVMNDLGEMELKGIAEPQHVFSLLPYVFRNRVFRSRKGVRGDAGSQRETVPGAGATTADETTV